MWEVEYTNEFGEWWNTLAQPTQDSITSVIERLAAEGVKLTFPFSTGVSQSSHSHMRELRIQHRGDPYRILYAFDPRRTSILLIGGNKRGNNRWYKEFIPIADRLYDEHLQQLRDEGLING